MVRPLDGLSVPHWGSSAPVRIDSHADSEGFGTMLARSTVRDQLRGDISRDWKPEGLTIRLSVAKDRITVK
jgi:two-component sensor histidine kinase